LHNSKYPLIFVLSINNKTTTAMTEKTYLERVIRQIEFEHATALNAWRALGETRPAIYYVLRGRVQALFQALTFAQVALQDLEDDAEDLQENCHDEARAAYADLRRQGGFRNL
jgi:hypothetical protein